MFSFFAPKAVQQGRQFIKDARKLLAYKRDLWSEATIADFEVGIDRLTRACAGKNEPATEEAVQALDKQCAAVLPPPKDAGWRENCEVFLVAIVIALGVRTYILQPFTIPTGSMQPTLNGIIGHPTAESPPNALTRLFQVAWFGRTWVEAIAQNDETVIALTPVKRAVLLSYTQIQTDRGSYVVHAEDRTLMDGFGVYPGRSYQRGEPIVRGYVDTGDHVFVDKVSYHFRRPQRGDVFVFNTQKIPTIENRRIPDGPSQFYIKRLVGLPGDELRIAPPELFINGARAQGFGFERVMAAQHGYRGYSNIAEYVFPNGQISQATMNFLRSPEDTIRLEPRQFWAQGDNSFHSSDSRDWGPVPQANIMGRGLFVYWPFAAHWGGIR